MDVGLDTKAVMEACNAIQKKHANMAVMLLSADAEKEKALAYAVRCASLPLRSGAQRACRSPRRCWGSNYWEDDIATADA